jgi:DNA polymerase III subunit delta'
VNLPWLAPAMDQLRRARSEQRLPNAILLHESPGVGGAVVAEFFAKLLLCTQATPACGQCAGCRRVERNAHPDYIVVPPDPELKAGQITVDQIRELSAQLALSSYEGRGTSVLITPADALNRNAANALLKTLEEPRADAHLVLLTATPSRLPATVRSRCQKLRLPAPTRDQALQWLHAEGNPRTDWVAVLDVLGIAPLEALHCDAGKLVALRNDTRQWLREAVRGRVDVVRAADQWAKADLPLRLRCIENHLTTCVLGPLAPAPAGSELRAATHLPSAAFDINIAPALRLLDDVRELQRLLSTPISKPLAMERQLWRINAAAAHS